MAGQIRAWENRLLRRVLHLMKRAPEDDRAAHMRKSATKINAELRRHRKERLHELVMKRIYWAAWDACHAEPFGSGVQLWRQVLDWRSEAAWKESKPELLSIDARNITGWRRPRPGRRMPWERPFITYFGQEWKMLAIETSRRDWKAYEQDFVSK
eukprot:8475723-Karenia_brevis.AAC.1